MDYINIKRIGISNDKVTFLFEANGEFLEGNRDIPMFLHKVMGNVYKINNTDLRKIATNCKKDISKVCNFKDFWHEINYNGMEKMDEMTKEIRSIFYRACDEINNYLRIF